MEKLRALIKNNWEFVGYVGLSVVLFVGCFLTEFAWVAAAYILLFAFFLRNETKIIGLFLFIECFCVVFYEHFLMASAEYWSYTFTLFEVVLGIVGLCVVLLYLLRVIKKEKKLNYRVLIPGVALLIYLVLPLHELNAADLVRIICSFAILYVVFEERKEINFAYLVRVFTAGIIISCVFGLYRNVSPLLLRKLTYVSDGTGSRIIRLQGLAWHPLTLSALTMLAMASLLVLKFKNKLSLLEFFIMFIPIAIFGYLTLSRAFIVTVVAAMGIFALLYLIRGKTKALPFLCLLGLMIGIVALLFFNETRAFFYRFIFTDDTQGAGELSEELLQAIMAGEVYYDPGRKGLFDLYLADWTYSWQTILFGRGISRPLIGMLNSHNFLVQALWTHGIIGCLFYVVIFLSLINWKEIKNCKQYLYTLILIIPFLLFASVELINYEFAGLLLVITSTGLLNQESRKVHVRKINGMGAISGANETQPILKDNPIDMTLFGNFKLSIIIPVYNGEKYIQACIDKVLQIGLSKEIIVINDGSTDNSLQLLQTYSDQIILISYKKNKGVSHARNLGLNKATGDYITFIDIDDDFELDMHAKILTQMLQKGADVGICDFDFIETNGKFRKSKYITNFGDLPQSEIISLFLQDKITPSVYLSVYSSKIAKAIQFDEQIKIGEDVLYQLKILLHAERVCSVDEVLYHYVMRDSSAMHSLLLSNNLLEHIYFKIPDCLTAAETEILHEQFLEKFDLFKLLMIQKSFHTISAIAEQDKKHAKKLLQSFLTKDICQAIMKNKSIPKYVKFEIFIVKTFGIGFHLFVFPVYQFVKKILLRWQST